MSAETTPHLANHHPPEVTNPSFTYEIGLFDTLHGGPFDRDSAIAHPAAEESDEVGKLPVGP